MENTRLVSAAADRDMPEVVRLVEKEGVDVDTKISSSGCTALHAAATYDLREIAGFLLSKGASIEQRANNGRTPLVEALVWQSWRVAVMLIGAGADVNVEAPCGAPLFVAVLHDCPASLVKYLLEKGAKVDASVLDVAEAKHRYGTLPGDVLQVLKRDIKAS
jgi:hypothetical protein